LALQDNQFVLLFSIITTIIVVVVGKTACFKTRPSLEDLSLPWISQQ
jgi:hypothetical protein